MFNFPGVNIEDTTVTVVDEHGQESEIHVEQQASTTNVDCSPPNKRVRTETASGVPIGSAIVSYCNIYVLYFKMQNFCET